jgi:hypothetical protein
MFALRTWPPDKMNVVGSAWGDATEEEVQKILRDMIHLMSL